MHHTMKAGQAHPIIAFLRNRREYVAAGVALVAIATLVLLIWIR
jgi:hypothetical protein